MAERKIKIRIALINYFMSLLIFGLMLTSCAPTATPQEPQPPVTQAVIASETEMASATPELSPTPEVSATPENTATATATATPENTPTPEYTATPEAMTQAEIRAEILAAGVNLDDLANSENEWVRSFITIDGMQESIDNNFGTREESWVNTVVIDIEGVTNQEEFDQELVSDGGWKFLSYAKLAYKMANGDWQIIKVPLMAYNMGDEVLWEKRPDTVVGQIILDKEATINEFQFMNLTPEGMARMWTLSNIGRDYHSGTGSFIEIFTGSSTDPKYANNDCIVGDLPRYSEEDLIDFRETGDPSIFGYQDSDGYWIFWPLVTFNAYLSKLTNYDHE